MIQDWKHEDHIDEITLISVGVYRQDDAEAESAQLREQISRLQTRNRTLCSQLEECQNEARSRLNEQHNVYKLYNL